MNDPRPGTQAEALLTGLIFGALQMHIQRSEVVDTTGAIGDRLLASVEVQRIGPDYSNQIHAEDKAGRRFVISVEYVS